jgi:hypothetical protein
MSGNFKPAKKIALLTFDDGFREFYDTVAPVLERKGIYACNFVNPAFIDNKDMMFRCKASLLIDVVGKMKRIDPEVYKILNLQKYWNRGSETTDSSDQLPGKNVLELLAERLEFDFKAYSKEFHPYLKYRRIKNAYR